MYIYLSGAAGVSVPLGGLVGGDTLTLALVSVTSSSEAKSFSVSLSLQKCVRLVSNFALLLNSFIERIAVVSSGLAGAQDITGKVSVEISKFFTVSTAVLIYLDEKCLKLRLGDGSDARAQENFVGMTLSATATDPNVANSLLQATYNGILSVSSLCNILTANARKQTIQYFQNLKQIRDISEYSFKGTLRLIEKYLVRKGFGEELGLGENEDWYAHLEPN